MKSKKYWVVESMVFLGDFEMYEVEGCTHAGHVILERKGHGLWYTPNAEVDSDMKSHLSVFSTREKAVEFISNYWDKKVEEYPEWCEKESEQTDGSLHPLKAHRKLTEDLQELKYKVDDNVWVITRNSLVHCVVINTDWDDDNSGYDLRSSPDSQVSIDYKWFAESEVFPTRADLIEDLIKRSEESK